MRRKKCNWGSNKCFKILRYFTDTWSNPPSPLSVHKFIIVQFYLNNVLLAFFVLIPGAGPLQLFLAFSSWRALQHLSMNHHPFQHLKWNVYSTPFIHCSKLQRDPLQHQHHMGKGKSLPINTPILGIGATLLFSKSRPIRQQNVKIQVQVTQWLPHHDLMNQKSIHWLTEQYLCMW